MNYLSIILGLALAAATVTAQIYRADDIRDKAALETLKANYAIAAASAVTHAAAVTAKDTKNLQTQGTTAIASAATKNTAVKVYYKTVYLPSLTKLDPKDEASKCAGLPVPNLVLDGLSASPGG